MKKKLRNDIFKTFLLIIIVAVAFIVTERFQYNVEQDYAQIATEQVNSDTDSYRILKSQDNVLNIFQTIRILIIVITFFILFNIWFKYVKLLKKEIDKNEYNE